MNPNHATAKLVLEDGCVFTGRAFGAIGTRVGEVVFNTAMTGYQEILTDPSYCGQIVTMTFPLIGNYGINAEDVESFKPFLSGLVVKELPTHPSNYRATGSLAELMQEHGIVGIEDLDTRALTRRIRTHGAVRGALSSAGLDDVTLVRMAAEAPAMTGANLAEKVAYPEHRGWDEALQARDHPHARRAAPDQKPVHVVTLDCGIKQNILRHLASAGCRVTVVPGHTSADAIRALAPDALMVGNGPGDPAAVTATIGTLKEMIGTLPIFGVCLGHQMLALALGAETYKLKFGHHGANTPVLNQPAQRVEITSQNHGFAVDAQCLQRVGGQVTHVNLNDESVEGFCHADRQVAAIQFHPEASPGPHDSGYVFDAFISAVRAKQAITPAIFAPCPEMFT
jgi:carbamoyl-phosphate synthase small subunit